VSTSTTLPPEFGASWSDFTRNWCLDAQLKYSSAETIRALVTLKRIWPERVNTLLTGNRRGVTVIVPAIDLGSMLTVCEHIDGFWPVFERLKNGERSAYSELVLVSALLRLGYPASFVAPLVEETWMPNAKLARGQSISK